MIVFHRAPSLDTAAEVQAWLLERGCTEIEVHVGADGLYRGSGVVRTKERP